jgi:tripartite-type tricarboxylate transporter receptor subunit TctC
MGIIFQNNRKERKRMRKRNMLVGLLVVVIVLSFVNASIFAQDFPEKDLGGTIMWGPGGACDNTARAITPLAEKYLGQSIILQNKPGATGALATQYVKLLPPDGYNLLYGSENPQLHKVLGLADFDYDSFYPINIALQSVGTICVPVDSPFETFQDLVNYAKENPGKLAAGVTGPGGLPFTVGAMLKVINEISFNQIPFDGEGPALTAMLGGHVDFTMVGLTASAEFIKAGKVKALAVVDTQRIEGFEDVPAITEIYPEYERFLPWGPFQGVWVRRDVPEERKKILVDVFQKAFKENSFQKFVKDFGSIPLGIYGEEADEFLKKWQSTSCWLLYEAGATERSPEEFGIPRP